MTTAVNVTNEPTGNVTKGLLEQGYYWGDADKQTIGKALFDQPDGSFILRNASNPGEYTLSVKVNSSVKLLRVIIDGEKCGFNPQYLTHDTIVNLIEFHRNISLNLYFPDFDVRLLYPISTRRNSQNGKPLLKKGNISQHIIFKTRNKKEWFERLEMERLRVAHMEYERAYRMHDLQKIEREKAEGLLSKINQACNSHHKKMEQMGDLLNNEKKINYDIQHSDEKRMDFINTFKANQKLVEISLARMEKESIELHRRKEEVQAIKEKCVQDECTCKARYEALLHERNDIYDYLMDTLDQRNKLSSFIDITTELIANESIKAVKVLSEMELRWLPSQYLMHSGSKEKATEALQHARERAQRADDMMGIRRPPVDGIFLIRPSASMPEKLVLSVLHGERISHCLLEQNEEGWGFDSSRVYMTTLSDFVRYYAHHSLNCHNDNIKCSLSMPAFERINSLKDPMPSGPNPVAGSPSVVLFSPRSHITQSPSSSSHLSFSAHSSLQSPTKSIPEDG